MIKSIGDMISVWTYLMVSCMVLLIISYNSTVIHNYRNVPKFSDRQVWANSADPDQTAPRGAV